jgi:hypothetical protein
MEMPQNIIAKYKLQETTEQLGESFVNKLKVFKSSLPDLQHLRFAECDVNGKPCNYISILNPQEKKAIQVTPEFMGDMAFQAMVDEAL